MTEPRIRVISANPRGLTDEQIKNIEALTERTEPGYFDCWRFLYNGRDLPPREFGQKMKRKTKKRRNRK